MKLKTIFFTVFMLMISANAFAQSKGRGFLYHSYQKIMKERKQQEQLRQQQQQRQMQQQRQQRNSSSSSYGNSSATNVMRDNSFSLANSYVKSTKIPEKETIKFTDGSRFYGFLADRSGDMTYADGRCSHGQFDSNWNEEGKCFVEFPNGSTYYGFFKGGVKDGEGSIFIDGKYYDVVFKAGTMKSVRKVANPKFDKAKEDREYQEALANFNMEMMRLQQDYSSGNSSSSSMSTSRSTSSRICNVCGGSGRCKTCNGTGWYTSIGIGSGKHRCHCKNGICSYCNGKGRK